MLKPEGLLFVLFPALMRKGGGGCKDEEVDRGRDSIDIKFLVALDNSSLFSGVLAILSAAVKSEPHSGVMLSIFSRKAWKACCSDEVSRATED
jgi:hypothetical protein